jgi:arabinofuranosyltransferase
MTIALLLTASYSMIPSYRGPDYSYVMQDRSEVDGWKEIGKWFKANAKPDDSIAVIPAGAIPYYSELKTIDMLGLNDVTIGRKTTNDMGKLQAGHEK